VDSGPTDAILGDVPDEREAVLLQTTSGVRATKQERISLIRRRFVSEQSIPEIFSRKTVFFDNRPLCPLNRQQQRGGFMAVFKFISVSISFFILTVSGFAQPEDAKKVVLDIRCEIVASVTTPGTFWDGSTSPDAPTEANQKMMDSLDHGNTNFYGYVTFTLGDLMGQHFKTISTPAADFKLIKTKDYLAGRSDIFTTLSDHVDADSIEFDISMTSDGKFMYMARVMKDGEDIFSADSTSSVINLNFSLKSKKKDAATGKSLFFQYSIGCIPSQRPK